MVAPPKGLAGAGGGLNCSGRPAQEDFDLPDQADKGFKDYDI
jgi:hypothetical protein